MRPDPEENVLATYELEGEFPLKDLARVVAMEETTGTWTPIPKRSGSLEEELQGSVAKLDRKILTTALKGTVGEMREHFAQCMSQRAAEMMAEDMEALGPVRIHDVQAAQQSVVTLVRQLQQLGVISAGRSCNEDYVV